MVPVNHLRRWVVERSRRFDSTLYRTERRAVVSNALLASMTAITVIRRLLRGAWTIRRWDTRPARRP